MKAEQRKQLETNVLADRMGRMVQDLRKRPSRRGLLIVGVLIVVLAAGGIYLFIRNNQLRALSDMWVMVGNGTVLVQDPNTGRIRLRPELSEANKDTTPAKVARYQEAWRMLWIEGLLKLFSGGVRAPAPSAIVVLFQAEERFGELYKENKDDPVLGPQALYNMAVAQEALAIYEPKLLDVAKDTYESVVTLHGESVYAQKANERLKDYKDERKLNELRAFYTRLHTEMNERFAEQMQHRELFERTFSQLLKRARRS